MKFNKKELDLTVKVKLALSAFDHLQEFDSRTGLALLKMEVLRKQEILLEDDRVMCILEDRNHKERASVCPGPLVPYYNEANRATILIIDATQLLLSQDMRARKGAFEQMLFTIKTIYHPKRSRLEIPFAEHQECILSNEFNKWSTSAIALYDLVNEDIFIRLATLRQCLNIGFGEGVKEYLEKVLKPEMVSVEWIDRPIPIPSSQHGEIATMLDRAVANSATFVEACDVYYDAVGTLPLSPEFGLSTLWVKWQSARGNGVDLWKDLWAWADRKKSTLARYHVCQLFCHNVNLVTGENVARFWGEVLDVLDRIRPEDPVSGWEQEWKLRRELANYYVKYFEIQRPERNSEAITQFAWWLADQVAIVFPHEWIERIRTGPIKHSLNNLSLAWQTINPKMQPSTLRFATLYGESIWSMALICQLQEPLKNLKYEDVTSEKKAILELAVGANLSICFPFAMQPTTASTYGYEAGIGAVAEIISEALEGAPRLVDFNLLRAKRESIHSNDQLLGNLTKILELDKTEQSLVAFAFRTQTYLNAISPEDVWKIVSNPTWFKTVFLTLDLYLLQFILDGMLAIAPNGGELWRCYLPHLIAIAAEDLRDDAERQKTLFLYMLLSSVSADTVSAIERLKRGDGRAAFAEQSKFLRGQFEAIGKFSHPWVSARIRPILVSLAS